ncbi:hypothetical protein [Longimicrobium sp.]|uniref:hypothetical protein n=1 Tax=Longimicrobium sp. TaxID=2029185 RepID=UPI002E35CB49|nr:hypothetical protein [Longimicrobium sp.]HEX6037034.1 hypothetical protein [Longimicrobium sp.]
MAEMGNYSRAYLARDLAAFAGWNPDPAQLRPAVSEVDGREVHTPRTALDDEDVVFLQEDFGVTDGIFMDEHVLFADAGPAWRAFCTDVLGFDPAGESADGLAEARPAAS